MTELHQGDRVSWNTSQGPTTGTVVRRPTEPCDIEGHHVAASTDAPQYLVESEKTGRRAVAGYVARHTAQRPDGDVTDTAWRRSLMNWGHDPLK